MSEVKGLPGLSAIRSQLDLTQAAVSKSLECSQVHLRLVELGRKDCTQSFQRHLSEVLCCRVIDLLEEPTPERLREIEIAYKRRELEQLEGDQKGVA